MGEFVIQAHYIVYFIREHENLLEDPRNNKSNKNGYYDRRKFVKEWKGELVILARYMVYFIREHENLL